MTHFSALRADYLHDLAGQVAVLRGRIQHFAQNPVIDSNAIAPVITQLRNLANSCAMFALPDIGDNARRGEQLLVEIMDGHLEWNDSTHQVLDDMLVSLAEAVSAAQLEDGGDQSPSQSTEPAASIQPRRVLFYARDHRLDDAVTILMQFGYQARQLNDLETLSQHVADYQPHILILPFSSAMEKQLAGMAQLPAIVFIAEQLDFATRLAALRAGGQALLTESPDSDELAALLAGLCVPPNSAPGADKPDYDIALINPDPELGRYYGLALQRAGMRPTIVQQPQALLDHLKTANCNAVISALQLAECDGLELAAVLRQLPTNNHVPLVFLANKNKTLTEQEIDTLRASGNDYLEHPVKAEKLIPIVANHARTHRTQSASSRRDNLTGVLNNHAVLKTLEQEILRAHRQQTALSIGLLSMDHFKRVNDGFGYAAGNSVIKSLAHLLTRRLRRSDIVGRLEGDVFLVILPDTDAAAAQPVLNTIRTSFGSLAHHGTQGEFTVSLSGGVVQLQADETADALLARADTTLYQAKRGGRNLIK